jgi:hypothetical protein
MWNSLRPFCSRFHAGGPEENQATLHYGRLRLETRRSLWLIQPHAHGQRISVDRVKPHCWMGRVRTYSLSRRVGSLDNVPCAVIALSARALARIALEAVVHVSIELLDSITPYKSGASFGSVIHILTSRAT